MVYEPWSYQARATAYFKIKIVKSIVEALRIHYLAEKHLVRKCELVSASGFLKEVLQRASQSAQYFRLG
jgi:hypothetical protein